MGWVRRNLATKDEKVEGLVVAHRADKQIQYALDMVSGITLMLYTVDFSLRISE